MKTLSIFFAILVCFLTLNGMAWGQKNLTWQSTSSTAWATAANWYDEGTLATSTTAPTSADIVSINNSRGATAQPSVTTAAQACKQLFVGNGFTLTIASGATAKLTFGDGLTGNNDVTIQSGGEVDNLSTASASFGMLNSANDKFRIDGGGKYLHNTSGSFSTPYPAAACDFDANSTVEWGQSSGNAVTSSPRTYGNLILSATSAKTYTNSGTSTMNINGTLTLSSSNVTFTPQFTAGTLNWNNIVIATGATLNFNSATACLAALNISGNITNGGTFTTNATEVVNFNGTTAISGNAIVFNNGFTVNAAKSLAIIQNTNLLATGKTATINGTFQLNEGAYAGTVGTFVYGASSTFVFNGTTNYGVSDAIQWPTTSGPPNVTVQNTGGITMNTGRTISGVFQTSAGVTNGNNLTLNGTCQINAGGYINGSPVYGSASLLKYNTTGTYGRGNEWNSTAPANVQISNNTALNYPNGGGAFATTLTGNLTVDAGSALYMNYGFPGTGVGVLTVGGNLVLNGSLSLGNQIGGDLRLGGNWSNAGTFDPQARAVVLNGTGAQSMTGATSFDYLTVSKASGAVGLANDVTINQDLNITAGTLNTGSQKVTLGASGTLTEAGNGAIVLGTVQVNRTLSGAGNQAFGNIGMELSPNTATYPGSTTVTRTTGTAQTGGGNQSILRYYDINAAVSSGLDLNMVFHYDNASAELNGKTESQLLLYRSVDGGTTWLNAGLTSLNNGVKTISLNNVTDLSRWTASDSTHPMVTGASANSAIISAGGESVSISSLENTVAPLTSSTGTQIWQVTLQDGGGVADADVLPTQLTAITFTQGTGNTVSNWSNAVLAADLFSGSTWIASGTVSSTSIAFTGLTGVSAPDDGTVTLSLRISLKNPLGTGVLDNQKFVLTVTSSNAISGSGTVSSQFAAFSAPASDNTSNLIAVAASRLVFTTQPADTGAYGVSLTRQPVVVAQDVNGNKDADYAGTVTLTNSGSFSMSGNATAASAGTASFSGLAINGSGSGVTLSTTNVDGLANATSNGIFLYGQEPTTQASALNFTALGATSVTLNWTNGNGANRLVIVRSGSAVSTNPVDGIAYTANPAFASGTAIGSGYVVYGAAGSSVTVTGLTMGTTYYFAVYEFNGTDGLTNYLTPGAAAFATPGYVQSAATGNWSATSTWVGGVVPTSTDNVLISTGNTVTVDNASAACNSVIFGSATTSKLSFGSGSVLSVYGDFTLKTTTHNAIGTWASGAKLRFTGAAKQTLSGWNTSSSSTVTTCLMEVEVDKSGDTLWTPGTDMKLNIGTSLEIIEGVFALGTADDINGKTLDQTAGTTPTITVQSGGTFLMLGGASQIMTGSTGALPIGKMTVYGEATFTTTSSNNAGFGGMDIEAGGVVTLTTGWGTGRFNPGVLTVKAGGILSNSGTTNLWNAASSVVLNEGGTFRTYSSTTPIPTSLTNNGTFRYTRSTSEQTIVDMDYSRLEISYDSTNAPKRWTIAASRVISDSLELNNISKLILAAATPQTVTVNGLVRLTTGLIDNSGNGILALGNGAVISRATGQIAAVPQFGSTVDVRYTSITGSVVTGPELPVSSATLGNLSIATTGQTVTLGANATVNGTLLLTDGKLLTDGYSLSLASAGTTSRVNGYVVGTLRKAVSTGAVSRTFEIGDASVYTPVDVVFDNVTVAGNLAATTTTGQHNNIGTSGLNPAKSLMRSYTLSNNGISFDYYGAAFTFDSMDVPSGSNPANFSVKKYDTGVWSTPTIGSRTATMTQATGMTSFSDFAIGEMNQYTLGVTTDGNGNVTKSPDQPSYASGASVELTAVPSTGWHFMGWSGDASGSVNPITITMDAAKNITATFAIDTFVVTASAINGIITPSGAVPATYGADTTFTFTPAAHYHLDSVFIDGVYAPSAVSPYHFTGITANHSIQVKFAIDIVTLTVNAVNGTVTKNPNQTTFSYGDTVRLTAGPDPTYNFVNWSGDAAGSTNPLTVVMDGNKNITANFSANTYTLGVTTVGNGTVAKVPDQASYTHGVNVTLTANPAPGSHFVNWTGDATGNTNPLTVTMDGNKSFVAHFAADAYTLTTHAVNGSITKNPNNATYAYGDSVRLTATPAPGYHFANWSGDVTGSTNPVSITINGNKDVTASFTIDTLRITVLPVVHGLITPGTTDVIYGSTHSFVIAPATGYHLDSISVDGVKVDSTTSFTFNNITVSHTIGAHFSINTYTITVNAGAHGTISPAGPFTAVYGDTVAFTISPASGYHIDSLYVDGVKVATVALYKFEAVQMNHSIQAFFGANTFTMTTAVAGQGSVTKSPDLATYVLGTVVELTAVPLDRSWSFSGWSGDATGTANPLSVTMDAAKNITATFVRDSAYLAMYRSFNADSVGLSKDNFGKYQKIVTRKAAAVDFSFTFTTTDSATVTFSFSAASTGQIMNGLLTAATWSGAKIVTTVDAIPAGTTLTVTGHASVGKLVKVGYKTNTTKAKKGTVTGITQTLRPAMPNRLNALYETMAAGAYGTGGLVVGYPQTKILAPFSGWFQTSKWADVAATLALPKSGKVQDGVSHGFDVFLNAKSLVKQQKKLAPDKYNSKLLGNLIGLKLSIASSQMGITPRGFGELLYKDAGSAYTGMMLKEIACKGDTLMMGWLTDTTIKGKLSHVRHFADAASFVALDSVIGKIVGAFEGAVDTVKFSDTLRFTGVKSLVNVPYLLANPSVAPAMFVPVAGYAMDEQMPESFTLYQNYPNPFNPTTNIQFALPAPMTVTLKVYNVLGQEVATLLDRQVMEDGIQELQFNAGNLASGVYFYRIAAEQIANEESGTQSANFVRVMKMVLVK